MADRDGQDLFAKLADRGEEALNKLGDAPGGTRVAEAIRGVRDLVDEVQKRARGIDRLEQKVAALEKRVAELEGPKAAKPKAAKPAPKRAAPKRTSQKRPPAAKPPASSTPPAS
jgi:hypothetical protein